MTEVESLILEKDILLYYEYLTGIPKSEKLDNEKYYQLYYSIAFWNHVYGGRGAAKSREVAGKLPVVYLTCLPFCRFVGVRQVYNTIKGSIFQEICDYVEDYDLSHEFKITRVPMKIVHKRSGNFMTFAGMDKPDSFKSIKDPTHVLIEEGIQLKKLVALFKVTDSVRTPKLTSLDWRIFILYNTDRRDHFLYSVWHDPDNAIKYKSLRDNSLMLHVTHHDNKFLPESVRARYEAIKEYDPERYKTDVLGEFGEVVIEGRFYKFFTKKNIKKNLKDRYDKFAPLHVTLDFNTNPYITMELSQLFVDNENMTITWATIDEICLTDSRRKGKTKETAIEFLNRYHKHLGNVVVYGDRSGHNKKTTGNSDFATIFLILKPTPNLLIPLNGEDPHPHFEQLNAKFKVIDKTNRGQNPSLKGREVFFERLHSGELSVLPVSRRFGTKNAAGAKRGLSVQYANYKIIHLVDPDHCPKLVIDYYEVQSKTDGSGKVDRDTKLTHTSDANDYKGVKIFDAEFAHVLADLK